VLKLTYNNKGFQKFSRGQTPGPRSEGRPSLTQPSGEGGREGRGRERKKREGRGNGGG